MMKLYDSRPILAITENGSAEYKDITEAEEKTMVKKSTIYNCISRGHQTKSGYCFDYVDD